MFLFSDNLEILGYRITPEGRLPTEKGAEAILSMPCPHNVSSVKRFLGMVGYFRDHVRNMFNRMVNLHSLLHKGIPFTWTSAHEAEFDDMKHALTSPGNMLHHPDFTKPFEVHTDASKHGCGAMLGQAADGKLRPVKFSSRSFSPTESCWPTTHQELFAVKWGLEKYCLYILGRKIKVVTDYANLKWLTSISPKQSKLACLCLSMAEFDFTIEHRAGSVHVVPDTFSRAPLPPPSTVDDYLIIPPVAVCSFLITALGYDIPGHTPQLISQVFDKTLHCLALSCDISPPSIIPPSPQVSPFKDDAPKHVSFPPVKVPDPPGSALWPDDLSSLHPLNITHFKFAKLQQDDNWLGPLIQYLISNNDYSVLGDLCKKDQSWVISTLK